MGTGAQWAVATARLQQGVAEFVSLTVPAPAGTQLRAVASCVLGGDSTSIDMSTRIKRLSVRFASDRPPPSVRLLPSSAAARVPLDPAPRLVVVDDSGSQLTGSRATGILDCVVQAQSHVPCPSGGDTCVSIPSGSVGERAGDAVVFPTILLEAAFGWNVMLTFTCRRTANQQQQTLPSLHHNVTTVVPVLHLRNVPASSLGSDGKLFPRLVLHDAAEVAVDRRLVSDACAPSQVHVGGRCYPVLVEDSVSMCSATLLPAAGTNASLGQASIVGATAAVVKGEAVFNDLVVRGLVGTRYRIVLSCTLGSLAFPSPVSFEVETASCSAGQQPSTTRLACERCPADHWSDDGNTAPCTPCPASGVSCSGGRLDMKPGFFLVESTVRGGNGTATLDGSAEFHSCPNPVACVLNEENRTVSCAAGYTGVLCAVCDMDGGYRAQGAACAKCWSPAASYAVLAALGLVLIAGLVYVASCYACCVQ